MQVGFELCLLWMYRTGAQVHRSRKLQRSEAYRCCFGATRLTNDGAERARAQRALLLKRQHGFRATCAPVHQTRLRLHAYVAGALKKSQ